jgi:hypothetical protein
MDAKEELKATLDMLTTVLEAAREASRYAQEAVDLAYANYALAAKERDQIFEREQKLWNRWVELNNAVLSVSASPTIEE